MAGQRRTFAEESKREAVSFVKQSGEQPVTVALPVALSPWKTSGHEF